MEVSAILTLAIIGWIVNHIDRQANQSGCNDGEMILHCAITPWPFGDSEA